MAEEKIRAVFIVEMLGKPADYVKKTMKQLINNMQTEKGIEIKSKNIREPKEVENTKGVFTTFAEIEAEFENILSLMRIIFVYMPSHLEIISPENLRISNFDLNIFFNDLIKKLHQYDEIVKRNTFEKNILENRLMQIVQQIKQGEVDKVKIDINKFIGVKDEKQEQKKSMKQKINKQKPTKRIKKKN